MRDRDWPEWVRHNATNILRLVIVALFLGLAVWAITLNHYELVIANHEPWLWLTVALVSVGPELAGIVIGVVTIDYLNERRQDDQLKGQLVLQMGSAHNDVTDTAIRALGARGWLEDGSLKGANLGGANLGGARLKDVNLSEAGLERANLSEANLVGANMSGAKLGGANLSEAILWNANLIRADLWEADLRGADLRKANLTGARLWGADLGKAELGAVNLSGANLEGANLRGAHGWTIEQLEQAVNLWSTLMPDGVLLEGGLKAFDNEVTLTFKEWKAHYLAKHAAEKAENEPNREPNDVADRKGENGSPGPI